CFHSNHHKVFIDVYIVTQFKFFIKALAFAYVYHSFGKCACNLSNARSISPEKRPIGKPEQTIPGEDSSIDVPFFMDGRLSSAGISIIHYIIVHECEIMKNFHSNGSIDGIFEGTAERFTRKNGYHRTNAFTSS